MNDRVIKNPNFKSNGEFHKSLAARGAGAKDFPNTHTEVEHLGNGKFAASLSVGHRVFFDKADGNKPKKHKLTDERPGKDYVLIQGAKCCTEVYPYYAKYFDVQHEEVRLNEERWVVQRLFKEPDEWRDVDAYNPVMSVEEYSEPAGDVMKVGIAYDTDYGTLTVEYFQRDSKALKHNVTFQNTSGSTETFRVLQRWAGIVASEFFTEGQRFSFTDGGPQSKLIEDLGGVVRGELTDFAEMLTGSRELNQGTIFDRDGIRFLIERNVTRLFIDGVEAMYTNKDEMSVMVKAVEKCPSNARVFIGGLGPGFVLYILANSCKAKEIVVVEKDQRIIDEFAPILSQWFASHHPEINLRIVQGDAKVEVSKHGLFDWIFMDFFFKVGDSTTETRDELRNLSTPNLTASGVYTAYSDRELWQGSSCMRLKPIEVLPGVSGLKTDFTYESWVLLPNEKLIIDPDTATLDDPTEDAQLSRTGIDTDACNIGAISRDTSGEILNWGGGTSGRESVWAHRAHVEWPIDSIALTTLTANPFFRYHGAGLPVATDSEINPITNQPSVTADATLWADIASGVAFVDPFDTVTGVSQSQDLGAAAKTDLQTAITASQSWWAIGFQSAADECSAVGTLVDSLYSEERVIADPKPTLYVEYELPAGLENKSANMGSKMVAAGLI